MNKYIYITIVISLFLISCNNNAEYEPDKIIEIGQMYPLIKNQDYKNNPIIPPSEYPQRCMILTTKEDLSKISIGILDSMPELRLVDFKSQNIIVVSFISDETIKRYVPEIKCNEEDRVARIMMTYYTDMFNGGLAEWIAIFQCTKENFSQFIVSFSVHY